MSTQSKETSPENNAKRNATNAERIEGQDLSDNTHDQQRIKPETVTLDLPDVKDIPGQENITLPPLGEIADTTISSDDEEGLGLFDDFDDLEDEDLVTGTNVNVSKAERIVLERADIDMPTTDDINLREAELDDEDFEGDPLNEGSLATDVSGSDLDEPGTEEDDDNEAIGEEDEENNYYSLGGDDKENLEQRST